MMLTALPETRRRFFPLRLALTCLLLALLLGVNRFLWYPGLLFKLGGAASLILVIAGVALVIGPGLSTLLYRPAKKGLLLDLGVIVVVELLAIGLAASALYERRPVFAVFAVDRFELVTASEIDWQQFRVDALREKQIRGPRLIFARMPDDPSARSELIVETVLNGLADIDRRPEFWERYEDGIEIVRAAAMPLQELGTGQHERPPQVRRWLAGQAGTVDDYSYVPVRGTAGDAVMVLRRDTGYPAGMLDVDPW